MRIPETLETTSLSLYQRVTLVDNCLLIVNSILGLSILFLFLFSPYLIFNNASAAAAVYAELYWSNGTPMTTARSEITSAVLYNKLYVIGGFENGHSTVSAVEVYDPIANKWTTVASLPQPLDHAAAAAASFDGKLYVVGGGYLDMYNISDKL